MQPKVITILDPQRKSNPNFRNQFSFRREIPTGKKSIRDPPRDSQSQSKGKKPKQETKREKFQLNISMQCRSFNRLQFKDIFNFELVQVEKENLSSSKLYHSS